MKQDFKQTMVISNQNENLLKVFEAKALKDYPKVEVKKGDKIFVSLMPSCRYYMSKLGTLGYGNQSEVFETWGKENIDFVRIYSCTSAEKDAKI